MNFDTLRRADEIQKALRTLKEAITHQKAVKNAAKEAAEAENIKLKIENSALQMVKIQKGGNTKTAHCLVRFDRFILFIDSEISAFEREIEKLEAEFEAL